LYWSHLVGFEGSIWYWHFVDVVWLFLFITIYWWSNS
jgi:heme/copper-type cytochrome/quinol oxidase subunit 3